LQLHHRYSLCRGVENGPGQALRLLQQKVNQRDTWLCDADRRVLRRLYDNCQGSLILVFIPEFLFLTDQHFKYKFEPIYDYYDPF
jgi:hypothetical protein